MTISVHQRIQTLIEETNDAFSSCGSVNADYADFASMALADFKTILQDPQLTSWQLKQLIRKAMAANTESDPRSWASFVAHYIAQTANSR